MDQILKLLKSWQSDVAHSIQTIDVHVGGEPLRIVTYGYPEILGDTMLEKRKYALKNLEKLRTAIMWEPRGHADMYGCLIVDPERESSDLGVLFLHNEGYSTMCGHGIIGLSVVLDNVGAIDAGRSVIKIDAPAGQITVVAVDADAGSATFLNVPSFVDTLDEVVEVEGLGEVCYDIAFGGAYYAFVDASSLGLNCRPDEINQLIEYGRRIKKSINRRRVIAHPVAAELSFLYGIIFIAPSDVKGVHSGHVCVFADGEVDRCPTGTGISGRAALLHARGEMRTGDVVTIESIIGSTFSVRIAALTEFAGLQAVVPEVSGTAYVTGSHSFVIDERDPLCHGFLLR